MNLFEKIFNYELLAQLEQSEMLHITKHERMWLKTMLQHGEVSQTEEALPSATLAKLSTILQDDEVINTNDLVEKVHHRSGERFPTHLSGIRQAITDRCALRLTYQTRDGRIHEHVGIPHRLEYSMVKGQWYLHWYRIQVRAKMSTRLCYISNYETLPADAATLQLADEKMNHIVRAHQHTCTIEVVPEYNHELSRILYALSSFDNEVTYDEKADTYRLIVHFLGDESLYLLSKVRFLGLRVRFIDHSFMQSRMLESATKALERYGITD